jgi:hypothetical protein
LVKHLNNMENMAKNTNQIGCKGQNYIKPKAHRTCKFIAERRIEWDQTCQIFLELIQTV